jgi:hypothetical protein
MIRRRLRGILRTTITTCIPWTVFGLLIGVLYGGADQAVVFGRPVLGGLVVAGAIVGALVGVVHGLTFSSLVLAAERGKSVEQLSGWRMGTWGAIATAGPIGLLFASPLIAGIGAVVGAAGALAALRLARRARVGAAHRPIEIA